MELTMSEWQQCTNTTTVDVDPADYLDCENEEDLYFSILDDISNMEPSYIKVHDSYRELSEFEEFKKEWLKLKENEINKK